jgi:hypothetical protein
MTDHQHCCGHTKRPKSAAELAALPYPSNPTGKDDNKNRIQNPDEKDIKFASVKKSRKGWWFRIDPTHPPPLLDGSGDGVARGGVVRSEGAVALHPAVDHLVCLNAASTKKLAVPPSKKPERCGFTWNVSLTGKAPNPKDDSKVGAQSGWIPLSALVIKAATLHHVEKRLDDWSCCADNYATWGRSLTHGHPTKKFKFRTTADLLTKVKSLGDGDLNGYFADDKNGAIKKRLRACKHSWKKLYESFGILPSCSTGNRLTDYMAKGSDFKNGFYDSGYTNLNANLSVNKSGPIMAPIPLDIFPANHVFTRLSFGKQNHVLGFVYSVPKSKSGRGKLIGRVVWYFGYCDAKGGERRYGWVPALALK